MKDIKLEEIKEIQLDILNAVHKFCMDNNIKYTLACGTLLGAIRHKGYIPWDDDIDIYMLREDYIKFVSLYPALYNNNYELISLERHSKWDKTYAKVYDKRTIIYEEMPYAVEIGINIDVFPIDNVPNSPKEWIRYNKKRIILHQCLMAKSLKISSKRNWYKNLIIIISKFFTLFISKRNLAMFINSYAQKYNKIETYYVFENSLGIVMKRRFRKNIFNELSQIIFENNMYMAFKNYDEYLKNAYGNYMELPPKEKRISHHSFKAYWK